MAAHLRQMQTHRCGLGLVAAVVFLFSCAERQGSGAAVICLSSTSVMAQRQHKTSPAREKGGERGMGVRWGLSYTKKLEAGSGGGFN